MTAHSTGQAPAAGPASTPTAVTDGPTAEAPKPRPSHPGEPTTWQRRTYRFGREAIVAIPVFALIAGLLPRSSAAFSIDPTVYAHYLANGRWHPREVLATIGLAVTGLLSIVGLASLLFRGRARGFALTGLVAGLAGSAGMLASVGSTVIREDRLPHAVVDGHRQLAFNADTIGAGSAFLVIGGALLLTLGWILLGVAVIRTSGMNRADGPLLMISTPLIFLGGMVVHVLPTMGSFLLLAAGLGIVATAGRISIIGEDTWRQRRRRPAAALTASVPAPTSATGADQDAGVPLDRAPGLAGALGLARPQLFPESRVASATIYHAPVASAAEASEPTVAPGAEASESTVVPAAPGPAASNGGAPANAEPPSAAPSTSGAAANGGGRSDLPAHSNGTDPSNAAAPSNAATSNGARPDSAASNGSVAAADATAARNGDASDGKPAANDRAPAVKSLRDLLRGARGAAATWPVNRSRSGGPNSGNAGHEDGGQIGNRSGDGRGNAATGRTDTTGRTGTTGRAGTSGRKGTNSSGGTNSRSGTNSRTGGRPDIRGGRRTNPSSAAGRAATGATPQPPPPPESDKPDPPDESPSARE